MAFYHYHKEKGKNENFGEESVFAITLIAKMNSALQRRKQGVIVLN